MYILLLIKIYVQQNLDYSNVLFYYIFAVTYMYMYIYANRDTHLLMGDSERLSIMGVGPERLLPIADASR